MSLNTIVIPLEALFLDSFALLNPFCPVPRDKMVEEDVESDCGKERD